jgi:oligopeptidase B
LGKTDNQLQASWIPQSTRRNKATDTLNGKSRMARVWPPPRMFVVQVSQLTEHKMGLKFLESIVAALLVTLVASAHADPGQQLRQASAGTKDSSMTAVNPSSTSASVAPPVAPKRPFLIHSPNGDRNDEYYWLRDDSRQSSEVLQYLQHENAYRDAWLAPVKPMQTRLRDELVARLKPDDDSVPVLEHGFWYYTRYVAGLEYPLYCRKKGSLQAVEQIMLDGNAMAKGHEYFKIGATAASPDGRFLAFVEDDTGRRQFTLKILDLETGVVLNDRVTNVESDIVWAADSKTLLYVEKDPVTLLSVRLRKHRLGSDPARDPLLYEESDHSYYMAIAKSRSEKYLFIELESTQQSEWHYADAADPELRFRPVLTREADHEYQVEHLDDDFIIRTNWLANNFRIVRAKIGEVADKSHWHDVVANRTDAFVERFEVASKYLTVNERSGGLLKIRIHTWQGDRDTLIQADEPAYSMTLVDTPDISNDSLRYIYTSLTTPATTIDFNVKSGLKRILKVDPVLGGFDSTQYRTEYFQARARDGTLVPVSVVYRKSTALDGTAPLFQYGYGSYGLSSDPKFRSSWLSLLDRGFVVAIAHIRGGQELGRRWYDDGRLMKKMNSFTDFIDVTRHLVKHGYGAANKVFAEGGSAGGLLMGAIANLAPRDYRAIVAHVPFVDVVTTMLDESIPLTTNEFDQWGNPKIKAFYDYMLSYSPYDNVKAQDYPAMLVITGLWDSQVQYYEPAKWVARLRALKTDKQPLLFSVDMAAGHGGKAGRLQRFDDTALEYAFIFRLLGIDH